MKDKIIQILKLKSRYHMLEKSSFISEDDFEKVAKEIIAEVKANLTLTRPTTESQEENEKLEKELNNFMDFCHQLDSVMAEEFRTWIDDYITHIKKHWR